MAADNLSATNLPPVSWTSNGGRELTRDSGEKETKKKRDPGRKLQAEKGLPSEIDFEPVEHQLDSIA